MTPEQAQAAGKISRGIVIAAVLLCGTWIGTSIFSNSSTHIFVVTPTPDPAGKALLATNQALSVDKATLTAQIVTNSAQSPGQQQATPQSVAQATGATPPVRPTASIPPAPKSGDILYEANWSNGLNGWQSVNGWKPLDGTFINDGSSMEPADWKANTAIAPYQPVVRNYAVEVKLQALREPGCGSFGIVVRDGYEAGIEWCHNDSISLRNKKNEIIKNVPYHPDTNVHVFRFEVQGITLRAMLDGSLMSEAQDSLYTEPGTVGLFSDHTQVKVLSFRVIAL